MFAMFINMKTPFWRNRVFYKMFLKCFAENIITLYKEKRNKKNNIYKMNYILT